MADIATTNGGLAHGAVTLFRVRGVPIRAHWTLLLIVPYLAIALSVQFRAIAELAGVEDARLVLPPMIWGAILALGLFASITLHELAHTLVARHYGGRVRSITLMLVGGASELAHAPQRPLHEALMAAAGPATSFALGGAFALGLTWAGRAPADVQMGLFYLAGTNLALGAFNLLPAFPMDGGRLLRALLAAAIGRVRATAIAASLGKWGAVVLGLVGLWSASALMVLIAVFIYAGATGELLHERVHAALDGLRIVELLPMLRRPPPLIEADAAAAGVLRRMHELDRLELVVVDSGGAPLGIIQAGDLEALSPTDRRVVRVGELVANHPHRHVVVPWHLSANEAIERAAEASAELVLVVDPRAQPPDDLVGLVAADDIARMVTLRSLARPGGPRSRSFAA